MLTLTLEAFETLIDMNCLMNTVAGAGLKVS